MKHITEFILESRELLKDKFNLITLDEFIKYAHAIDNYDEDSDDYKKVKDIITTAYGEKIAKSLDAYTNKMFWKYKDNPEYLYNNLLNIPVDRLSKIIGAGSFSTAFDLNKSYVLKRAHDTDDGFNRYEMKFYEYLLKRNKCPYFPVVLKLNKHLVLTEKLNIDTPKCRKYVKLLMFTDFSTTTPSSTYPKFAKKSLDKMVISDYSTGKNTLNEMGITDPEIHEVYRWYMKIYTELAGLNLTDYIDLGFGNVGERKDGTIVFFDAIADM